MIDCIKMGRESVLVPGNRLNLFTGFYLHDMFMNFDEILVGVGNVLHSERIVPCIPETDRSGSIAANRFSGFSADFTGCFSSLKFF